MSRTTLSFGAIVCRVLLTPAHAQLSLSIIIFHYLPYSCSACLVYVLVNCIHQQGPFICACLSVGGLYRNIIIIYHYLLFFFVFYCLLIVILPELIIISKFSFVHLYFILIVLIQLSGWLIFHIYFLKYLLSCIIIYHYFTLSLLLYPN